MCTSNCQDPSWSYLGELFLLSLLISTGITIGTFVFAFLDGKLFSNFFTTLSTSLLNKLSWIGFLLIIALACIGNICFFVIRFYGGSQLSFLVYAEVVSSVLLLIYDCLRVLASSAFGTRAFLETAASLLGPAALQVVSLVHQDASSTWFSFTFLASTRLSAIWRILAHSQPKLKQFSKLADALVTIYVRFCILLVICCSLIAVVESINDPDWLIISNDRTWSLVDALYFVVLCVVTVGSNLSPVTTLGRLITVMALFAGLSTLIVGVRQYAAAASIRSSGKGSYVSRKRRRCVLVTGNPIFETVRDMIQEFFHPDHADDSADLSVVFVFAPGSEALEATHAFLSLQASSGFNSQVQVFQANVLDTKDMARVGVDEADTIVVVPCLTTNDPTAEDTENITRIFSLRSRTKENVRILGLFFRAENKALMDRAELPNVEVLSLEDYKMRLIGISASAAQGFLSLVSILCKTIGEYKADKAGRWRLEYEEGLGSELYEVPLANAYREMSFGDCFVDIYQRSESALLLGVIVREVETDQVLLNPGFDFVIPSEGSISGIFIAPRRDLIVQRRSKHAAVTPDDDAVVSTIRSVRYLSETSDSVNLVKSGKPAPAPPVEVLLQGGHALVCIVGEAPDTVSIRALVEAFGTEREEAIVVLSQKLPRDSTAAAAVGRVYFVTGCPTAVDDLDRVNYTKSSRCVILQSYRGIRDENMADSEVVLCSLLVRRGSEGRVTTINEISLESSLRLLARAGEDDVEAFDDSEFFRRKAFAQGTAFVASTVASVLANTIYNPSLMTICTELVSRNITTVDAHEWVGRVYADVLRDCMRRGLLPMAIGRLLPFSAEQRYVYVAPPARRTTIQSGDTLICVRTSSK